MDKLTKEEKRALQALVGEAYEAELAAALVDVETAITQWRRGEILPSEVQERIHQFHKQAQEIYNTYNYTDREFVIARAVSLKFIELSAVPDRLQPKIQELKQQAAQLQNSAEKEWGKTKVKLNQSLDALEKKYDQLKIDLSPS